MTWKYSERYNWMQTAWLKTSEKDWSDTKYLDVTDLCLIWRLKGKLCFESRNNFVFSNNVEHLYISLIIHESKRYVKWMLAKCGLMVTNANRGLPQGWKCTNQWTQGETVFEHTFGTFWANIVFTLLRRLLPDFFSWKILHKPIVLANPGGESVLAGGRKEGLCSSIFELSWWGESGAE